MNRHPHTPTFLERLRRKLPFLVVVCLLTTLAALLPPPQTEQLKLLSLELTLPFRHAIESRLIAIVSDDVEVDQDICVNEPGTRQRHAQELMRLQLLAGQLQQQLSRLQATQLEVSTADQAEHPSWLSAKMKSARLITQNWKPQLENMLRDNALVQQESESVLEHSSHWIDLGYTHGLKGQELVLTGDAITGRIARVGHMISQVQSLNDPQFRLPVQILYQHSETTQFSPEGSLHGSEQGEIILEYIPTETPVAIGDLVVTTPLAPGNSRRALVGTIRSAEMKTETGFWSIHVVPVSQPANGDQVSVLMFSAQDPILAHRSVSPPAQAGAAHD